MMPVNVQRPCITLPPYCQSQQCCRASKIITPTNTAFSVYVQRIHTQSSLNICVDGLTGLLKTIQEAQGSQAFAQRVDMDSHLDGSWYSCMRCAISFNTWSSSSQVLSGAAPPLLLPMLIAPLVGWKRRPISLMRVPQHNRVRRCRHVTLKKNTCGFCQNTQFRNTSATHKKAKKGNSIHTFTHTFDVAFSVLQKCKAALEYNTVILEQETGNIMLSIT